MPPKKTSMNRPLRVMGCIAVFCTGISALAMGLGRQDSAGQDDRGQGEATVRSGAVNVRATGRVRLVGSGSLTELVISGEDREWHVDKKDEAALREFQQQIVTVEGTETSADLTFANGFPAGRRYALRDITIIKISGAAAADDSPVRSLDKEK
jgi:hypothetical protein